MASLAAATSVVTAGGAQSVVAGLNQTTMLSTGTGHGASVPGPEAARINPHPVATASLRRIEVNARWILQAQIADGAIAWYTDRQFVSPYLGNFAAMGLARATSATRDPVYVAAAWRWLDWYQAHEDARGFVTDYRVRRGVPTSTHSMDSTDAYAGTFLSAAAASWEAAPDPARLDFLRRGIEGAVAAIEATQDSDGLTWARPGWHVKYLMDQSEVYGGLKAAVVLARARHDGSLAIRAESDARRMAVGVAALWNKSQGAFDWAVYSDGVRQRTNWTRLYPDAMEQAWAVAYGLATPAQARIITSHLSLAHSKWNEPRAIDSVDGKRRLVGYWAVAGWAFEQSEKKSATRQTVVRMEIAAAVTRRRWPFTSGVAGELIVLDTGGLSLGT